MSPMTPGLMVSSLPADLSLYDPARAALVPGVLRSFRPNDYSATSDPGFDTYWSHGSSGAGCGTPLSYLALVSHAVAGTLVEFTAVGDGANRCTPQWGRGTFTAVDKLWQWSLVMASTTPEPQYTTAGTDLDGSSPSQKWLHIHMPGGGESARTRIDIEGTTFTYGFGFPGRSYSATLIPGATWTNSPPPSYDTWRLSGELYCFAQYHEKLSAKVGRQRVFMRQVTSGGQVITPSWEVGGHTYDGTSSGDDFPQAHEGVFRVNRNRAYDAAMKLYYGFMVLVDGDIVADPLGIASLGL